MKKRLDFTIAFYLYHSTTRGSLDDIWSGWVTNQTGTPTIYDYGRLNEPWGNLGLKLLGQ